MRIVSNEQSVAYHNSETTLNDNNTKKNRKKYGSDSDLSIDEFRFALMYLHGKTSLFVFFLSFFLLLFSTSSIISLPKCQKEYCLKSPLIQRAI